ncbi:hypothetical protein KKA14_13880 [bacterium]|nr:hypothetical protein [bacterium]
MNKGLTWSDLSRKTFKMLIQENRHSREGGNLIELIERSLPSLKLSINELEFIVCDNS